MFIFYRFPSQRANPRRPGTSACGQTFALHMNCIELDPSPCSGSVWNWRCACATLWRFIDVGRIRPDVARCLF